MVKERSVCTGIFRSTFSTSGHRISLEDVLIAHSLREPMPLIPSNMKNFGKKHCRRSYHMDLILRTLLSAIMVTKELILASFIWYWDCTGTFAYDRARICRIQVTRLFFVVLFFINLFLYFSVFFFFLVSSCLIFYIALDFLIFDFDRVVSLDFTL